MGLFFDAVYTFREIFLGVIDRHDNGNQRLFGHIFFSLRTQVIECLEKDRCVLLGLLLGGARIGGTVRWSPRHGSGDQGEGGRVVVWEDDQDGRHRTISFFQLVRLFGQVGPDCSLVAGKIPAGTAQVALEPHDRVRADREDCPHGSSAVGAPPGLGDDPTRLAKAADRGFAVDGAADLVVSVPGNSA